MLIATGRKGNTSTLCEILNKALGKLHDWCIDNTMKVNADKSFAMHFSKSKKDNPKEDIYIDNNKIKWTDDVRYLGVQLDKHLNWKKQIEITTRKAKAALFMSRKAIGINWGLKPSLIKYIYESIICPRIKTGIIVWWPATESSFAKKLFDKIYRLALQLITGCPKSTPTIALTQITGILPIQLYLSSSSCRYKTFSSRRLLPPGVSIAGKPAVIQFFTYKLLMMQPSSKDAEKKIYFLLPHNRINMVLLTRHVVLLGLDADTRNCDLVRFLSGHNRFEVRELTMLYD